MNRKLKKCTALLLVMVTTLSASIGTLTKSNLKAEAASQVIAFPGATGGGSLATGGRGGSVVHVTNLNDSGTGSFRQAVSGSNRIVVFDVSGTIELKSDVVVSSNITIAGQTAPGGSGITLKNYKLGYGGENVICRFISSRPGERGTNADYDAWGGANGTNTITDHCSLGWANDEQWGLYSKCDNITIQYSVIGPSNSFSYHSKGIHGFGIMLGRANVTYDHNLIVHNVSRNFRGKVTDKNTADFTNNVIYNWASQTAYGTLGHVNYVGNTLKKGVSTVGGHNYVSVGDSGTAPENYLIYLAGNRFLNKDNTEYSNFSSNNWAGIKYGNDKTEANTRSDSLFAMNVNGKNVSSALTAESSEKAYEHVIDFAGNGISSDKRTEIDRQVAYETETGTGALTGARPYSEANEDQKATIDKYKIECGVNYKYPSAVTKKTITDSDNDGMPDEWELARGLDPNNASDTNGDYCGQGYTNIEYYINDLTVNSFPEGVVTLSPELEAISAFEKIEAENFNEQSGVKTEECSEGGKNVGYIENGDYIMFRNVDFEDGAKSFSARIAGTKTGGKIELYLDSLNASPIAQGDAVGTGNWQDWTDISFNVDKITGKHDLYLKFTGSEGFLFNMNYFIFSKSILPLNGKLIKNLIVKDAENSSGWLISQNFTNGSLLYGDRDITCSQLPEALEGAEIIMTACDSKNSTSDLSEFTAGADITVYTAMDSRVTSIPNWLNGWEKTELTVSASNGVTYLLYKNNFTSGDIVKLGTNGQSSGCVNYTVFVTEKDSKIQGDVNADGVFTITDAAAMQKYLVNSGGLSDWKAADLNNDNILNVFDLMLMKRKLLENNN